MVVLICVLLVLVLINLIFSIFIGILLVRVLESVMHLGRDKPARKPDPRTSSGLPPGLVDVPPLYDVHGNVGDTHNMQDQTLK
jgi:hypothetical protein